MKAYSLQNSPLLAPGSPGEAPCRTAGRLAIEVSGIISVEPQTSTLGNGFSVSPRTIPPSPRSRSLQVANVQTEAIPFIPVVSLSCLDIF